MSSRKAQFGRLGIVGSAIYLAFALLLVVLGGSQALSYANASSMLGFNSWVDHTYRVLGGVDELAGTMKAAESAARGYMSQPQDAAHTEFLDDRTLARKELSYLRSLMSDNPAQERRLAELADLFDARLNGLEGYMWFRRSHDLAALQRSVKPGPVMALRKQLDQKLAEVKGAETRLLASRTSSYLASVRRAELSFWVATLIGLAGLLGFFALASRALDQYQNRGRFEAERSRELEARVTERTTELTELNDDLRSFSYSVAHDLRAPLRAIAGLSHLLRDDLGQESLDDSRATLTRIIAGAARMAAIIDDIVLLARLNNEPMRPAAVDLTEVAERVTAETLPEDQQKRFKITIEPGMTAFGDEAHIRILLANLIGNAIKYSAVVDHPSVNVEQAVLDGERVYRIIDNGVGFDDALSDRLFKPFERLHSPSEFEGTGLGLAICAKVIRRHGGRIWIRSSKGQGTTVSFSLEMKEPENASADRVEIELS